MLVVESNSDMPSIPAHLYDDCNLNGTGLDCSCNPQLAELTFVRSPDISVGKNPGTLCCGSPQLSFCPACHVIQSRQIWNSAQFPTAKIQQL